MDSVSIYGKNMEIWTRITPAWMVLYAYWNSLSVSDNLCYLRCDKYQNREKTSENTNTQNIDIYATKIYSFDNNTAI